MAITGYAEPNEAWHIARPMAFVGVWRRPEVAAGQPAFVSITLYADGNRAAVQAAFAQRAIEHLLLVVRAR